MEEERLSTGASTSDGCARDGPDPDPPQSSLSEGRGLAADLDSRDGVLSQEADRAKAPGDQAAANQEPELTAVQRSLPTRCRGEGAVPSGARQGSFLEI